MLKDGIIDHMILCIEPDEEIILYSNTEEWYLNTYFYDSNLIKKWNDKNLKIGEEIGKFRSSPCIKGKYSWMNNDLFDLIYNDNKILFIKLES